MVYWFKIVSESSPAFLAEVDDRTLQKAFDRVKKFYPGAAVFALDEKSAKRLQPNSKREKIS